MAHYYLIARSYYTFHYEFLLRSREEALDIQIAHNSLRFGASANN